MIKQYIFGLLSFLNLNLVKFVLIPVLIVTEEVVNIKAYAKQLLCFGKLSEKNTKTIFPLVCDRYSSDLA